MNPSDSPLMRVTESNPFWTANLLLLASIPLSVWANSRLGWTSGAATTALFLIPALAYVDRMSRVRGLIFAALGMFAVLAEPLLSRQSPAEVDWILVGLSSLWIGLTTALIVFRSTARTLNAAASVASLRAAPVFGDSGVWPSQVPGSFPEGWTLDGSRDQDAVDYAMLLLTLQDVGRRIGSSLDLETLIPTIISTTCATLRSEACEVYLWSPGEKSLARVISDSRSGTVSYLPRPEMGGSAWVLSNRQVLTRSTLEGDANLGPILRIDPDFPSAVAPLAIGTEVLGLLVIENAEETSGRFVRLLYILAGTFALGIKNALLFRRIEDMARLDGLTGLVNHVSFHERLEETCRESQDSDRPLVLIMSDVDFFKDINDRHGHPAGDEVLRELARLWKAVLPESAIIARYGGEEFICALTGEPLSRGVELAELLRRTIAEFVVDFEGRELKVTASFGVAEWGTSARSARDLVRAADRALYLAKSQGRNRVEQARIGLKTGEKQHASRH